MPTEHSRITKDDIPRLDADGSEKASRFPWIFREGSQDRGWRVALDDVKRFIVVADWPPKGDETSSGECVHELRVFRPKWLLLQREISDPTRTRLTADDEVSHAFGRSGADSNCAA
jgi:hypothetical protein